MNACKIKAIDKYMTFAEACDDDLDIMAFALKNAGCSLTASQIKGNFERYKLDGCIVYFDKVKYEDIINAKRAVQLKTCNRPTLF